MKNGTMGLVTDFLGLQAIWPEFTPGAVASWLAHSTPKRAVWVQALARDIVGGRLLEVQLYNIQHHLQKGLPSNLRLKIIDGVAELCSLASLISAVAGLKLLGGPTTSAKVTKF